MTLDVVLSAPPDVFLLKVTASWDLARCRVFFTEREREGEKEPKNCWIRAATRYWCLWLKLTDVCEMTTD